MNQCVESRYTIKYSLTVDTSHIYHFATLTSHITPMCMPSLFTHTHAFAHAHAHAHVLHVSHAFLNYVRSRECGLSASRLSRFTAPQCEDVKWVRAARIYNFQEQNGEAGDDQDAGAGAPTPRAFIARSHLSYHRDGSQAYPLRVPTKPRHESELTHESES